MKHQAARTSLAAARNRDPIPHVLRDRLPSSARGREIASGIGGRRPKTRRI
jgi:hypothetical protein